MIETKWMVLANPRAGSGKMGADWNQISDLLHENDIHFDVLFTEYRYHAVELVIASIRRGYRKFISIGGDGTINEVVNGFFLQRNEVPTNELTLAVIPAGSGNDWVKMFNLSKKYSEAVSAITRMNTMVQDICRLDLFESKVRKTRYMINVSGIGFDAVVAGNCNRLKEKGVRGKWIYLRAGLNGLFLHRAKHYTIRVDDRIFYKGKVFSVALGIGRFCGGGMQQTPNACVDDGLVDITIIKRISKLKIVAHLKKLFDGRIFELDEVLHTTAKTISIVCTPNDFVEVDGEVIGETPYTLEIIPASLKVVTGFIPDQHQ